MTQQAWETAMGMRGYVGSPAEREARAAFEASLDGIRVGVRVVELDNPLVEKHLALRSHVMLHRDDCSPPWLRRRHYVARKDDGGWYIRRGKRGQIKTYLSKCEITYIDGDATLFQFRAREG